VLPFSTTLECFEAVAWRRPQELQRLRRMKLSQLSFCDPLERPEAPDRSSREQRLRVFTLEERITQERVLRRA
jgi:hypothetical protein